MSRFHFSSTADNKQIRSRVDSAAAHGTPRRRCSSCVPSLRFQRREPKTAIDREVGNNDNTSAADNGSNHAIRSSRDSNKDAVSSFKVVDNGVENRVSDTHDASIMTAGRPLRWKLQLVEKTTPANTLHISTSATAARSNIKNHNNNDKRSSDHTNHSNACTPHAFVSLNPSSAVASASPVIAVRTRYREDSSSCYDKQCHRMGAGAYIKDGTCTPNNRPATEKSHAVQNGSMREPLAAQRNIDSSHHDHHYLGRAENDKSIATTNYASSSRRNMCASRAPRDGALAAVSSQGPDTQCTTRAENEAGGYALARPYSCALRIAPTSTLAHGTRVDRSNLWPSLRYRAGYAPAAGQHEQQVRDRKKVYTNASAALVVSGENVTQPMHSIMPRVSSVSHVRRWRWRSCSRYRSMPEDHTTEATAPAHDNSDDLYRYDTTTTCAINKNNYSVVDVVYKTCTTSDNERSSQSSNSNARHRSCAKHRRRSPSARSILASDSKRLQCDIDCNLHDDSDSAAVNDNVINNSCSSSSSSRSVSISSSHAHSSRETDPFTELRRRLDTRSVHVTPSLYARADPLTVLDLTDTVRVGAKAEWLWLLHTALPQLNALEVLRLVRCRLQHIHMSTLTQRCAPCTRTSHEGESNAHSLRESTCHGNNDLSIDICAANCSDGIHDSGSCAYDTVLDRNSQRNVHARSSASPKRDVLTHLRVLDLSGNELGHRAAESVGMLVLHLSDTLRELRLARNPLGERGCQTLAMYLAKLTWHHVKTERELFPCSLWPLRTASAFFASSPATRTDEPGCNRTDKAHHHTASSSSTCPLATTAAARDEVLQSNKPDRNASLPVLCTDQLGLCRLDVRMCSASVRGVLALLAGCSRAHGLREVALSFNNTGGHKNSRCNAAGVSARGQSSSSIRSSGGHRHQHALGHKSLGDNMYHSSSDYHHWHRPHRNSSNRHHRKNKTGNSIYDCSDAVPDLAPRSHVHRCAREIITGCTSPSHFGHASCDPATPARCAGDTAVRTGAAVSLSAVDSLYYPSALRHIDLHAVRLSQYCTSHGCRELVLNIFFCCPDLGVLDLSACFDRTALSQQVCEELMADCAHRLRAELGSLGTDTRVQVHPSPPASSSTPPSKVQKETTEAEALGSPLCGMASIVAGSSDLRTRAAHSGTERKDNKSARRDSPPGTAANMIHPSSSPSCTHHAEDAMNHGTRSTCEYSDGTGEFDVNEDVRFFRARLRHRTALRSSLADHLLLLDHSTVTGQTRVGDVLCELLAQATLHAVQRTGLLPSAFTHLRELYLGRSGLTDVGVYTLCIAIELGNDSTTDMDDSNDTSSTTKSDDTNSIAATNTKKNNANRNSSGKKSNSNHGVDGHHSPATAALGMLRSLEVLALNDNLLTTKGCVRVMEVCLRRHAATAAAAAAADSVCRVRRLYLQGNAGVCAGAGVRCVGHVARTLLSGCTSSDGRMGTNIRATANECISEPAPEYDVVSKEHCTYHQDVRTSANLPGSCTEQAGECGLRGTLEDTRNVCWVYYGTADSAEVWVVKGQPSDDAVPLSRTRELRRWGERNTTATPIATQRSRSPSPSKMVSVGDAVTRRWGDDVRRTDADTIPSQHDADVLHKGIGDAIPDSTTPPHHVTRDKTHVRHDLDTASRATSARLTNYEPPQRRGVTLSKRAWRWGGEKDAAHPLPVTIRSTHPNESSTGMNMSCSNCNGANRSNSSRSMKKAQCRTDASANGDADAWNKGDEGDESNTRNEMSDKASASDEHEADNPSLHEVSIAVHDTAVTRNAPTLPSEPHAKAGGTGGGKDTGSESHAIVDTPLPNTRQEDVWLSAAPARNTPGSPHLPDDAIRSCMTRRGEQTSHASQANRARTNNDHGISIVWDTANTMTNNNNNNNNNSNSDNDGSLARHDVIKEEEAVVHSLHPPFPLAALRSSEISYAHPPGHFLCRCMHLLHAEGRAGAVARAALDADLLAMLQPVNCCTSHNAPTIATPRHGAQDGDEQSDFDERGDRAHRHASENRAWSSADGAIACYPGNEEADADTQPNNHNQPAHPTAVVHSAHCRALHDTIHKDDLAHQGGVGEECCGMQIRVMSNETNAVLTRRLEQQLRSFESDPDRVACRAGVCSSLPRCYQHAAACFPHLTQMLLLHTRTSGGMPTDASHSGASALSSGSRACGTEGEDTGGTEVSHLVTPDDAELSLLSCAALWDAGVMVGSVVAQLPHARAVLCERYAGSVWTAVHASHYSGGLADLLARLTRVVPPSSELLLGRVAGCTLHHNAPDETKERGVDGSGAASRSSASLLCRTTHQTEARDVEDTDMGSYAVHHDNKENDGSVNYSNHNESSSSRGGGGGDIQHGNVDNDAGLHEPTKVIELTAPLAIVPSIRSECRRCPDSRLPSAAAHVEQRSNDSCRSAALYLCDNIAHENNTDNNINNNDNTNTGCSIGSHWMNSNGNNNSSAHIRYSMSHGRDSSADRQCVSKSDGEGRETKSSRASTRVLNDVEQSHRVCGTSGVSRGRKTNDAHNMALSCRVAGVLVSSSNTAVPSSSTLEPNAHGPRSGNATGAPSLLCLPIAAAAAADPGDSGEEARTIDCDCGSDDMRRTDYARVAAVMAHNIAPIHDDIHMNRVNKDSEAGSNDTTNNLRNSYVGNIDDGDNSSVHDGATAATMDKNSSHNIHHNDGNESKRTVNADSEADCNDREDVLVPFDGSPCGTRSQPTRSPHHARARTQGDHLVSTSGGGNLCRASESADDASVGAVSPSTPRWNRRLQLKTRRLMRIAYDGMARGSIALDPQHQQVLRVGKGSWEKQPVRMSLEWEIFFVLTFEKRRPFQTAHRAQMLVHPVGFGFEAVAGDCVNAKSKAAQHLYIYIERSYSPEEVGVSTQTMEECLTRGALLTAASVGGVVASTAAFLRSKASGKANHANHTSHLQLQQQPLQQSQSPHVLQLQSPPPQSTHTSMTANSRNAPLNGSVTARSADLSSCDLSMNSTKCGDAMATVTRLTSTRVKIDVKMRSAKRAAAAAEMLQGAVRRAKLAIERSLFSKHDNQE